MHAKKSLDLLAWWTLEKTTRPRTHASLRAVAAGMICQEFDRQVTTKTCRRLGKKVPDKIQNLLVTLSSADEANYLLSNAKQLRQSQNEFVRQKIFINADQTPAEAKAAYELRCARRSRCANRIQDLLASRSRAGFEQVSDQRAQWTLGLTECWKKRIKASIRSTQ